MSARSQYWFVKEFASYTRASIEKTQTTNGQPYLNIWYDQNRLAGDVEDLDQEWLNYQNFDNWARSLEPWVLGGIQVKIAAS